MGAAVQRSGMGKGCRRDAGRINNDGGANLPNLYVVLGKRVIDLSGLSSDTQIYSLGNVELAGCGAQEPLIVAATKRVDA